VTNDEIDNLLDLRIRVRKDLQDALTRDTNNEYSEKVLDQVVEQATVKYPAEMVEEYIDDLLKGMDQNLRERGLSLADYQRIEKKDDAALRDEFREAATARLKRALVLGKVVDAEQLIVTDDDVDARIDAMSQQFGEQAAIFKQMMSNDNSKQSIAMDLITGRSLQRLSDIAKGENPAIGNSPADESPSVIDVTATPVEAETSESSSVEGSAPEAVSAETQAPTEAAEQAPSDEPGAASESPSGDNLPA
jgi:FKBP-type peptidyl-prolyl cis-trans isomerase (trigger factor)